MFALRLVLDAELNSESNTTNHKVNVDRRMNISRIYYQNTVKIPVFRLRALFFARWLSHSRKYHHSMENLIMHRTQSKDRISNTRIHLQFYLHIELFPKNDVNLHIFNVQQFLIVTTDHFGR